MRFETLPSGVPAGAAGSDNTSRAKRRPATAAMRKLTHTTQDQGLSTLAPRKTAVSGFGRGLLIKMSCQMDRSTVTTEAGLARPCILNNYPVAERTRKKAGKASRPGGTCSVQFRERRGSVLGDKQIQQQAQGSHPAEALRFAAVQRAWRDTPHGN